MDIRTKKILVYAGSALVFLLVALWVYKYLSTGTITVTTDDPDNYVAVSQILEGKSQTGAYNKQAPHKLTVRVKPGQYELTATSRTIGTSKIVTLKARQHISFDLNPSSISFTEPVLGQGATSIAADASQMLFIDPVSGYLMRIDSANNLSSVDTAHIYKSAVWSGTNFGVAQDNTNSLFTITDGAVSKVQLPFPIDSSASNVTYTVAPDNTIYVSNAGDIYMGGASGAFKKIYTAKHDTVKLSASNGLVAITYTGEGDSEGNESSVQPPNITVIDTDGKVVGAQDGAKLYNPEWSKDGKYLAVQGEHGYIIFNKSLGQVLAVPTDDPSGLSWINSTDFLYGIKNQLWQYSLSKNQSQKISQVSLGIDEISASTDGAYAYVVSGSPLKKDTLEVTRTGLKGQSVPDKIQNLDLIFPEDTNGCSINYVNFSRLEVTVRYSSTATPDFCVNVAKKDLRYYSIDSEKFQFTVNTSSDSRPGSD